MHASLISVHRRLNRLHSRRSWRTHPDRPSAPHFRRSERIEKRLTAFVWSRVRPGTTSLRFYNLVRLIPVQRPQRALEGIQTHGFDQMMIHARILRT